MAVTYSVSLSQIIKEVGLETVFMPSNPEELLVTCSDVNRPGLALGGYYEDLYKRQSGCWNRSRIRIFL